MSSRTAILFPIIGFIYFFNSFGFPHGLVFTALLCPVFIYSFVKDQSYKVILIPVVAIAAISSYHYVRGAEIESLFFSSGLFLTAVYFALWLWNNFDRLELNQSLMTRLLKWTSLFIVLASALLPFASLRELMWYEIPISPGVTSFPRLKMFTYEASYFAFLFAPLFLFHFWKLLKGNSKHNLLIAIAILLPLALSLSFGVIAALLLCITLTFLVFSKEVMAYKHSKKVILYGTAASLVLLLLIVIIPNNPVLIRIENIFSGTDTSANGRLSDSFMFAYDLANHNDLLFGVGLGQIKILAHDLIVNYYQYEGDFVDIVRIPNSVAEWLATFGFVGMIGKIWIEVYFFFKLKLYNNYFNFSLFMFVFIYQFTGSYLVSTAEIILWIVAIKARFSDFDRHQAISVQL